MVVQSSSFFVTRGVRGFRDLAQGPLPFSYFSSALCSFSQRQTCKQVSHVKIHSVNALLLPRASSIDPPVFNNIPWNIFKGLGQYSLEAPSIFKLSSATSLCTSKEQEEGQAKKKKDKPRGGGRRNKPRRRRSQDPNVQDQDAKSECKEETLTCLIQTGENSSLHLNLGC